MPGGVLQGHGTDHGVKQSDSMHLRHADAPVLAHRLLSWSVLADRAYPAPFGVVMMISESSSKVVCGKAARTSVLSWS
ncbi:hypothetical protein PhaeoP78_03930 (plasmid) [Phaeobacter inhibens]|nr:hypothetical protein PhaeoP78_03930 [Phaeobacter inhibens]